MPWRLGRAGLAGVLVSALCLLVLPSPAAVAQGSPAWYGAPHRTSLGADTVARRLAAGLPAAAPMAASVPCKAEHSRFGNVQVNCRAEDGKSPQNTQSETSVAVSGAKVVVGYNDSLVCCTPFGFTGYSVSHDSGRSFTDMGVIRPGPDVQSLGDPAVAVDDSGTFYMASLATNNAGDSLLGVWSMPKGSDSFTLKSVPVNVGSSLVNFADKEYLAIGRDSAGQQHFYLSWTFFSPAVPSPIRLSQSTDGVHWHTSGVAEGSACSQASTPLPAGDTLYVSYEQSVPIACVRGNANPAAVEVMAAVQVTTGKVMRRTSIASVLGSGDAIVACNGPTDLREVIETAPGHDMRTFELPSITRDPSGTLYAIWQDRPGGVGGSPDNATRIYLSYSMDGDKAWSAPVVISGPASSRSELDRVQPWLSSDSRGLHAMWYERVPAPAGPDLIRTDKEDLTFATSSSPPVARGEVTISISAPIAQTNPNQDPVISNCYAGDYNNIVSTGTASYVTWGDDRNPSAAPGQMFQPDVFLQRY